MQRVHFSVNNHTIQVLLRDEADQSVAAEIFTLREYRIAEELIKTTGDTIIDGGAHSGLFTLYARALNPLVPIVAVEPEEGNLALLKKHLSDNSVRGVEVISGALAGTYGKKKLVLSEDSHNHRLEMPGDEVNQVTAVVQGYSLSDILKRCPSGMVGLLKLDIEGGEYDVFAGADAGVFSRIQAIIMEYHTIDGHRYGEVEQQLREQGFGVQIFPSRFDKSMGFLWAVNKRLKQR